MNWRECREYLLCYAKEIEHVGRLFTDLTSDLKSGYKYKDENFDILGPYKRKNLYQTGIDTNRPNLRYPIKCPDGSEILPPTIWRWEKNTFDKANDEGRIDFIKNASGEWQIYTKMYLYDEDGKEYKIKPRSLLLSNGYTKDGNKELINLLDSKHFDYPKPSILIQYLISIHSSINESDIILDFFSGSATTAHAVMQLNAEDGGNRRFIMVQLPEACDENTEAYKTGFKNISEIGKERIRRAGEQIKKEIEDENRQSKLDGEPRVVPDIGFRVLKIDDTNMKDVYYSVAEYSQETIEGLVDNVKEDRTDLDLLYQVLINWGLPLDLKHEMEEIDGFTSHIVDTDALIACFEPNIPESVMRKIAEKKPLRAVFRDGSFRNSPGKLNIEGIFKTMAPDTKLRVI
jgi:adenine-specific DNA-methyltransferase